MQDTAVLSAPGRAATRKLRNWNRFLVFGKAIGSGVPGAAYGFTQKVADMILERHSLEDCDTGGIGGTQNLAAVVMGRPFAAKSGRLRGSTSALRWSTNFVEILSEKKTG
jgi:hypothetical protein